MTYSIDDIAKQLVDTSLKDSVVRPYRIEIEAEAQIHYDIALWANQNVTSWIREWRKDMWITNYRLITEYTYTFESEEDAMHFALRWK